MTDNANPEIRLQRCVRRGKYVHVELSLSLYHPILMEIRMFQWVMEVTLFFPTGIRRRRISSDNGNREIRLQRCVGRD